MDIYWGKEADACDEFVQSAFEYYYVDTVAELLLPTGLLIDKSTQYVGSFEKYVFLKGNKNEIYTRSEIDFISEVGDIIVFAEFHKDAKRGVIPCRVIAVKNPHWETLRFCIAFTKIINKASDGFNICFVVSEDGIIFTCRAYDEITASNYYISDIIKTEAQMQEICDRLMYSSDYSGFIEYYTYIRASIKFKEDTPDFILNRRNAQRSLYAYIERLQEIELAIGMNFSGEIEKSFWGLDESCQETYADKVAEADDYLFKIEPSQVNTMEMLFEAEEMEKLTVEAEQRNENLLMQQNMDDLEETSDLDEETKALLADPESLIKLLKKKRGI